MVYKGWRPGAVLSGWSAVRYWNIPFIDAAVCVEDFLEGLTHVTVYKYRQRYRKAGQRVGYCRIPTPGKYFYRDEERGILVASPELTYMQIVKDIDIHLAILVAICFCAYPRGMYSEPLTTPRKLRDCARALKGMRGRRKALRALKYAKEGCNSPREALVFMALSLPNALGGMGLRTLRFNRRFVFRAKSTRRGAEPVERFADFALEKYKVVIEYNSLTHHASAEAQMKDVRRQMEFASLGFECVNMYTSQMSDPSDFEQFALYLFSQVLGKRLRIRIPRFWQMRLRIQELIVEPPIEPEVVDDRDRYAAVLDMRERQVRYSYPLVLRLFQGPSFWGFVDWRWKWSAAQEARARRWLRFVDRTSSGRDGSVGVGWGGASVGSFSGRNYQGIPVLST
ncbi:MAG: hypothetical protein GX900_05510 [Clostridiaceae bacterium]|nr:hypothetical protein [Clostridiaceae bacterium]